MSRNRLRVFAAVVACLAGSAAGSRPLRAQQVADQHTYTVKRGDTLWGLAKQLLGDAYLWPEIYRLNVGTIADPHWIYPGQLLKMPGAGEAPAEETAPALDQQRVGQPSMTVFNPAMKKARTQAHESLVLGARSTALRAGEYVASPFMWAGGGPKDGGLLERTAEEQGIDLTLDLRPIQYREDVFIRVPKNAAPAIGQRFLVYRLGQVVLGQGQVVVPTGVVRLSDLPTNGVAKAELLEKFEDVFAGQGVIPLDSAVLPKGVFPAPVEFGLATRVSWLYNHPVLATTGQYLILQAGSKDGLKTGDQITLLRARGVDSAGVRRPDEEVAFAVLTRITPWGAAAIVVRQHEVGIAEGMRARVSAKMP